MTIPMQDRLQAALMAITAVGVIAYWSVYFTSGATHVRSDAVYLAFENAFPLADGVMSIFLLLAAQALWQGRRRAVLWGICAGSTVLYLGCMDFLFNVEQGNFRLPLSPEMAVETLIVAWCLGFGPVTVWRSWRRLPG